MTNPSQHGVKLIGNTFNPHGINIRLIFAPDDMLWIPELVYRVTEHTVREFRDPACYEVVNII